MDKEQATKVIGVEQGSSDYQAAYEKRKAQITERLNTAPTDALKAKYQAMLDQLEQALTALKTSSNSSPNLSQTMIADLPGATPSYTQHGTGGEAVSASIGLAPGQVLAERYEIREQIGQGGMGVVFRAYDQNRSEDIAIKVLLPGLLSNEAARERFLSEAKLSSQLSHPNIVNVFDVQSDGEYYFLTMELLEGQNLRQMMDARKMARQPFTEKEAIHIATTLAEGLGYAHGKTVHRDIKPENIWIDEDENYKIMDFGIARLMRTSQMTQTGAALGTAYYMAPEQLKGSKNIDGRADQYALGVLMYELLTGDIPAGRIKSVREQHKEISRKTSDIIDIMLETDPGDRFDSMSSMAVALNRKASGISLPSVNSKGLSIAVAVMIVMGVGALLLSSGSLGELWDKIRPLSAEEEQALYAEAIQLEGEVKGLTRRLSQSKKDLEARIKEGENNIRRLEGTIRSTRDDEDKQLLEAQLDEARFEKTHNERLQKLTDRIIYEDTGMLELEGKLQVAQSMIRDKQYPPATEMLKPIKENLSNRLVQITQAEEYLWAYEKLLTVRRQWRDFNDLQKLQNPAELNRAEQEVVSVERLAGQGELDVAKTQATNLVETFESFLEEDKKLTVNRAKYREQQTKTRKLEKSWREISKEYNQTTEAKEEERIAQLKDAEKDHLASQSFLKARGVSKSLYGVINSYNQQLQVKVTEIKRKMAADRRKQAIVRQKNLEENAANKILSLMEMVKIPGGTFRMGFDGSAESSPQHDVKIKPFKMMKHEVTFEQYDTYLENRGLKKNKDEGFGRGKRPVIFVSWYEAVKYAEWLSSKTGLTFRLPSEAEWEYAAQGGKGRLFYYGGYSPVNHSNYGKLCSDIDFSQGEVLKTLKACMNTRYANIQRGVNKICSYAHFSYDEDHKYRNTGVPNCEYGISSRFKYKTAPVGTFKPNPFGLYDMLGNVSEMTLDCKNGNYVGASRDGSPRLTGDCDFRISRGGSAFYRPVLVTDRGLNDYENTLTANYILREKGFRLVQEY